MIRPRLLRASAFPVVFEKFQPYSCLSSSLDRRDRPKLRRPRQRAGKYDAEGTVFLFEGVSGVVHWFIRFPRELQALGGLLLPSPQYFEALKSIVPSIPDFCYYTISNYEQLIQPTTSYLPSQPGTGAKVEIPRGVICHHEGERELPADVLFTNLLMFTFCLVELGLIIGKSGRNIAQVDAEEYIAGYGESTCRFLFPFAEHVADLVFIVAFFTSYQHHNVCLWCWN